MSSNPSNATERSTGANPRRTGPSLMFRKKDKRDISSQMRWHTLLICALRKQQQADFFEFKASLVYVSETLEREKKLGEEALVGM